MTEARGIDLLPLLLPVAAETIDEVDRHVARMEFVAHMQLLGSEIDTRCGGKAVEKIVSPDTQIGFAARKGPFHAGIDTPRRSDVIGALQGLRLIVTAKLEDQIGFS